jgi:hypothetical protein
MTLYSAGKSQVDLELDTGTSSIRTPLRHAELFRLYFYCLTFFENCLWIRQENGVIQVYDTIPVIEMARRKISRMASRSIGSKLMISFLAYLLGTLRTGEWDQGALSLPSEKREKGGTRCIRSLMMRSEKQLLIDGNILLRDLGCQIDVTDDGWLGGKEEREGVF